MLPNNNLYEDVVVNYQKLTKNSDPEKFFSEFYGKIVLCKVKNMLVSKICSQH